MAKYSLPPKDEIIILSKELQVLWKEWTRYTVKYDDLTRVVWWRMHGPRIRQIQNRVNRLRINNNIPCYGTAGGRKKVFFPVGF